MENRFNKLLEKYESGEVQPKDDQFESLLGSFENYNDPNDARDRAKKTLSIAVETELPVKVIENNFSEIEQEINFKGGAGGQFKGTGATGRWDKIGLKEQITRMDSMDWLARIPFSPAGVIKPLKVMTAAKRLQEDKYDKFFMPKFTGLTPSAYMPGLGYEEYEITKENDRKLVEDYLDKLWEEQSRNKSWSAKVFDQASYLPAWMIEFMLTGGLAKLGKTATKEIGVRALQGYAKTKGGQLVLKTAGWAGGAITRASLGMPHRIAQEIAKNRMPKQMRFGDDNELVIDIEGDNWASSILKGWGNVVIEAASEEAGATISGSLTHYFKRLPMGGKILEAIEKLRPAENVNRIFTKAGWSNFIGEVGEERLATLLHGIFDTEDFGADEDANIFERLQAGFTQDIKNLPIEIPVLALPSGARLAASKIANTSIREVTQRNEPEMKTAFETGDFDKVEEVKAKEQDELSQLAQGKTKGVVEEKPVEKPEKVIMEEMKPTKIKVYRGTGVTSKQVVKDRIPAQFAEGTYYSTEKSIAETYGPKVEESEIILNKPYKLRLSDEGPYYKDLKKEFGTKDPSLITKKLVQQGYDSLIISNVPVNRGEIAKRDSIEVIIFSEAKPTPAPAEKEAWEMTKGEFDTEYNRWFKQEFGRALTGMEVLTPAKQHAFRVQEAVEQNKPVPRHVLEEYKGEKWADEALEKVVSPVYEPTLRQEEKPALEIVKELPKQLRTENEQKQIDLDASANEAVDATRQYTNESISEDVKPEEPTAEDIGFIRNTLHNLGIKSLDGYHPISDKDFRDIYKFLQMPYDIAKTHPEFEPVYQVQRAREMSKAVFDHKFAEMTQPYFQLKDKERKKVDAALFEADRNPALTYGSKRLKGMGLNEKQINAFLAIRNSLDISGNVLIEQMKAAGVSEETLDEFRARLRNYIPHKWYGNWAVVAKEGGKTVFMTATNYTDRFNERDRLKKLYPDADIIILKRKNVPYEAFQQASPWAVQRMIDLSIEKAQIDPMSAAAMREALTDLYKAKGFGMHFIKRKDIPGYTEDLSRPLAEYFAGFTGYVSKMQAIKAFPEAVENIHPARKPNLYRYSLDYIKYVTGDQMEFGKAKRAAYFWYLFGNIKSAVLNGTQNFTLGWPVLSKHTNFALPKMLQAMARTANPNLLTEGERKFIGELEKQGYLEPKLAQEISAFSNNPIFQPITGGIKEVATFFDYFRHMESFNRKSMAVALYDAGITDLEHAAKLIEESHFRYSKGNRPVLARGYISPVMTFRSWGINYFTWMKNEIKAGRISPMVRSLSAITLFGGLKALPFAGILIWAWRKVFEKDPEAEIRDALGSETGRVLMRGLPSTIGISFTGSVSPLDIPTPTDLSNFEKSVTEIGGVFADIPNRVAKVSSDLSKKDYLRALEDASPETLRNPLAAYRLYTKGARSKNGRPILDLETGGLLKIKKGEAIEKSLGFQPVRLSEQWDIQEVVNHLYTERMERKQNWVDRFWLGYLNKDLEAMREVLNEHSAYNKKMIQKGHSEDVIPMKELDDMLRIRAKPINIPARYMLPAFKEIHDKYYND